MGSWIPWELSKKRFCDVQAFGTCLLRPIETLQSCNKRISSLVIFYPVSETPLFEHSSLLAGS